jgi:hypothetical protein
MISTRSFSRQRMTENAEEAITLYAKKGMHDRQISFKFLKLDGCLVKILTTDKGKIHIQGQQLSSRKVKKAALGKIICSSSFYRCDFPCMMK